MTDERTPDPARATPALQAAVRRAAAGDRVAYAELVRHYQRPLAGFLARMGLTAARIEELAQDTFVRAWTHLPRYRPQQAQFSTWLYTIARRLALNELDRAAHRHEVPAGPGPADEAADPAGDPARHLLRRRRDAQLHQALRALPHADRSVLALAYVKELDVAQIAAIEGCAAAAVRTRLTRARQRLLQALHALGPLDGLEGDAA
jgi:RNA polymerase sigma-70 factor (ECF subfamily)